MLDKESKKQWMKWTNPAHESNRTITSSNYRERRKLGTAVSRQKS